MAVAGLRPPDSVLRRLRHIQSSGADESARICLLLVRRAGNEDVRNGVVSMPFSWPFVDGNQLEANMGARFKIEPGSDGEFGPALLTKCYR